MKSLRWRVCRWAYGCLGSLCVMVSNAGFDIEHAVDAVADRVRRFGGVTWEDLSAEVRGSKSASSD